MQDKNDTNYTVYIVGILNVQPLRMPLRLFIKRKLHLDITPPLSFYQRDAIHGRLQEEGYTAL